MLLRIYKVSLTFLLKKDVDGPKHRAKKPVVLPRSDSIGSGSGRKYLTPTLSDPASIRSEKDKNAPPKKRNNRLPRKFVCDIDTCAIYLMSSSNMSFPFEAMAKNNLPHLTESTEQNRQQREVSNTKATAPKSASVMLEVREWWREQLAYSSESSEDEV